MPTPAEVLEHLADPRGPAIRREIAESLRRALGASVEELVIYAEPAGDPGLFGPDSMAWRVHGDLPAMLIGGLSALMLQSLHPLAMAGVAAHSRFREDPMGRLQRTARFIAGTTFGGLPLAEGLLEEVQALHTRVVGTAPDGRAYAASDPALLTFVHTAEVWSFLRAYQRYAPRPLLHHERDAYLAEVALIAERLGAEEVPGSVAAVRVYLGRLTPDLVAGEDAAATMAFLRHPGSAAPLEAVGHEVLVAGAVDLLPGFAKRLFGVGAPRELAAPLVRAGALALGAVMRWSLGPSAVRAVALARLGAP